MRHFRYFVAVADAGSFVEAARRMHVAQPALSRLIRDLEKEIGVMLFDRLPRGVRLTPAGAAFLIEARRTMENAARAVAIARREARGDKTLRLSHVALFSYSTAISDLLTSYRSSYPDYQVKIRRFTDAHQRTALREGKIDAAITFLGEPAAEGFNSYLLLNTWIEGVVLPASHPLAQSQRVSLRNLRDLTWLHIAQKSSPEMYNIVKSGLASRGLFPKRAQSRPLDASVAAIRVAAGDAWMLSSEAIGRAYEETSRAMAYRPFVEEPMPVWLALIWDVNSSPSTVLHLVETARSLGLVSAASASSELAVAR